VERATASCRACRGSLRAAFPGTILGNIEVEYLVCSSCGTLQLADPHWLDRAYEHTWNPDPDTGRIMRSQAVHRVIRRLRSLRLLPRRHRSLDHGSGLGILVRLLRDEGKEAWGFDPYSKPCFAEDFILPKLPEGPFDLITAAEVIEHTMNPQAFLTDIRNRLGPNGILLLTTELYEPRRIPDPTHWHYLAQDYGQHITFLSGEGLRRLADAVNVHWFASLSFVGVACIHLLSPRQPIPWKVWRLKLRHYLGESRFGNDARI